MRKPLVFTLVVCLGILLLGVRLKYYIVHVVGISMEPTIHNQMAVAEHYWFSEPQRGDIIMFVAPPDPKSYYGKRVIGIPGDIISINGATVTLDGVALSEPYVSPFLQGNSSPYQHLYVVVPPDYYFVMGDDRKYSYDSRAWGFVKLSSIVGRLVYLYGSPDNTGFLPDVSVVFSQIHQAGVFQTSLTSGKAVSVFGSLFLVASPPVSAIYKALLFWVPLKKQSKRGLVRQPALRRKCNGNPRYRLGSLLPPIAIMLLPLLLVLSACAGSGVGMTKKQQAVPVILEQPLRSAYQPNRTIDVWLDDTSSYPREYFMQAKSMIANAIDQAVQVNSGGMTVFINIITSNSWNPDNTLLTIIIPPLVPDPLPPLLQAQATPTGDPFTDGQAAKKVNDANAQALAQYQRTLRSHHTALAQVRAQVHRLTDTLRRLNPAIDTNGVVDMWGMFGRASQRLNAGKSMRLLLIASSLEQNTWRQFAPYETLWGVHVRVLWHYCLNAPECIQTDTFWRGAFLHAGAAPDIKFDDPAQSTTLQTNLFV